MKTFLTIEKLPYPIVEYPNLYGCFMAFRESPSSVPYLCECFKLPLRNAFNLWALPGPFSAKNSNNVIRIPQSLLAGLKIDRQNIGDIIDQLNYKPKLCHRCNSRTPIPEWCASMYGGVFKQKFGWYIEMFRFEQGFMKGWLKEEFYRYLPEVISPSNLSAIEKINSLHRDFWRFYNSDETSHQENLKKTKEAKKLARILESEIENQARIAFGHKKIGDQWTSETILFELVKNMYPQYHATIKRHFRPEWLEGLEFDIYLEPLKLAFEYQGIQHFEAVEHWGGKEGLKKVRARDKRKSMIAKRHGITLVYINYDEPLFEDFIQLKIQKANDK